MTGVVSDCAVEVDGIPRHVKDLRLRMQSGSDSEAVEGLDGDAGCDEALMVLGSDSVDVGPRDGGTDIVGDGVVSDERPLALRRPPRNVVPPDFQLFLIPLMLSVDLLKIRWRCCILYALFTVSSGYL